MRQAGRTAGSLEEVAAKVHCVTRAMMAVVPKAPGVKVLGISFIRKERDFMKEIWCKISGEKSTLMCALTCAGANWLYLPLNLFALIAILLRLFQTCFQ